jgi:hypothetical protein
MKTQAVFEVLPAWEASARKASAELRVAEALESLARGVAELPLRPEERREVEGLLWRLYEALGAPVEGLI